MASRQEEKERRRQERLAAEQAAAREQANRKRIGYVLAGVVAAALVVFVVLAVTRGDDEGANQTIGDVQPPAQRIADLEPAARAAGCTLRQHPIEGQTHVPPSTNVRYRTNPPTSGDHTPNWAEDGIYRADNPPDVKMAVHTLEHGRVNFQYRAGTDPRRVNQLEAMFNERVAGVQGYRSLLYENQTGMQAAVAATAWGRSLTCPRMNDRVFDALRAFRRQFQGKGPEFFP